MDTCTYMSTNTTWIFIQQVGYGRITTRTLRVPLTSLNRMYILTWWWRPSRPTSCSRPNLRPTCISSPNPTKKPNNKRHA